jgi:hypothetical protein
LSVAYVNVFSKVVQGINPDLQEVKESESALMNASDSDITECSRMLLESEQAWEFVHGKEGPSRMAEFKRLKEDNKLRAAVEFARAFVVKYNLRIYWSPGNSPQGGSCPAPIDAIFRKAIEGKEIGKQEILGNKDAQFADYIACAKIFLYDEKAWEFVYGKQGSSKMAEFKTLLGDKKDAAEMEFMEGFFLEIGALFMKAVAPGLLRQM